MPPEDDNEGTSPSGEAPDPVEQAVAEVEAQIAQAPESVRNTPEYRALAQRARASAREAGSARAREARAREDAEALRLAAEAQQQADVEARIGALPEAARAAYQELVDLGQTDPVAAARRLGELMTTSAQSAGQEQPGEGTTDTAPEGATVPAPAPRPMSGGVDGNASLSQQSQDDPETIATRLDKVYNDAVERNQNGLTRNRVTMKERAAGMIAYLGAAYTRATAEPPERR